MGCIENGLRQNHEKEMRAVQDQSQNLGRNN